MAFIKANFLSMRDENGKDLGTMATGQAKDYARKRGLELVSVDETIDPPVYKVQPRRHFVPNNNADADRAAYSITADTVRLTDETGKSLGVVPTAEAKKMAAERGLDLIAVNNGINPPIGKLGDLSKYIYDKKKKDKELKKKEDAVKRASEIKMLKLTSDTTDSSKADRNRIIAQANKFLADGHPVKLNIKFYGREIKHASEAMDRLRNEVCIGITAGTVSKESTSADGTTYTIQLTPSKKK